MQSTQEQMTQQPPDPANIRRLRGDFPPGYEVADLVGPGGPIGFWGLGADWLADPPQCGALANPVGDRTELRGLSASGPGGIIYAALVTVPAPPVTLDPALLVDCGQWTATSGRATAAVSIIPAPAIDGAATIGLISDTRTVVEGGTETDSRAHTFTAYLGEFLAFVVVVTDPGSPYPTLAPDFGAALLVKTVSALRD